MKGPNGKRLTEVAFPLRRASMGTWTGEGGCSWDDQARRGSC
jgi:hypothetical protein